VPLAGRQTLVLPLTRRLLSGELASRWGAILRRLIRSAIAGGLATVVDLAVLMGLVSLAQWTARSASVPALVAGAVAAFVAQKYYAFQAVGGPVVRQATQFALVQVGSAVLTGVFYDLVLGLAPAFASAYVIVRLVTSNIVWLGFSFPLWHFVFRVDPQSAHQRVSAEGALADLHRDGSDRK
jgi:putative flippase GtrA